MSESDIKLAKALFNDIMNLRGQLRRRAVADEAAWGWWALENGDMAAAREKMLSLVPMLRDESASVARLSWGEKPAIRMRRLSQECERTAALLYTR